MSKKDKSKFKKRIKAEILEQMAKSSAPITSSLKFQENFPEVSKYQVIPKNEVSDKETFIENEKVSISKDLKKSALIIAIMTIIVLGAAILDVKTNLILKSSNWLFEIFNIQV